MGNQLALSSEISSAHENTDMFKGGKVKGRQLLQYDIPEEQVTEIDQRDIKTPDDWIPRHPELIRLTGRHPFNCEPPVNRLVDHGFITPTSLHYVRNHGAVPNLDWDSHRVKIFGLVNDETELSMDDFLTKFETISRPVTLVCAGNRRKEQNMHKQGIGFSWGPAAVSTSVWTGVRLKDVLDHCGIKSQDEGANHICFVGADPLPGGYYGTSISYYTAMDTASDVMLAWEQNGKRLTPDHGYPIRLIIPGYIGGRMVKWLTDIEVTSEQSSNHYHYHDNRVLPPQIDAERALAEKWWYKPEYIINDLNINSAITSPAHGEELVLSSSNQQTYKCKGYAYSGGGRQVTRVELSFDDGETWDLCTLNHPEKPTKAGKYWCWCFWEYDVSILKLVRSKQMMVRAWDTGLNTQPINFTWNVMGMMNNCTFKVKIDARTTQTAESLKFSLAFEHPTQPGALPGGWMVPKTLESQQTEHKKAETKDVGKGNRKLYPLEEVAKHTTKEDCWFVYDGKVFDSTSFMDDHPGGADSILLTAGEDATEEFDSLHSEKARKMLDNYYIGDLASEDAVEVQRNALPGKKSSQVSLYEKVGGEAAIQAVVEKFYEEKVLKDNLLSPIFESRDIKSLKLHQKLFLKYALGGTKAYDGRSMSDAHRGLGIKEPHWKAVCGHLVNTLTELGVSREHIDEVVQRVLPLHDDIVEAPSSELVESNPIALDRKKKNAFALLEKVQVSHNTIKLRFALPTDDHILGLPVGKHMFISAKINGSMCMRAYTPITGDEVKGHFDLVIKVYFKNEHPKFPEGGKMSQYLNELQLGQTIDVRGPLGHINYLGKGEFNIDGTSICASNICMMAGGTGITPMFQVISAILRDAEDFTNVFLIYANNTEDDILLLEELDQMSKSQNCSIFHTLATPKNSEVWKGGVGFITEDMVKQNFPSPSKDTLVLMCGPPPMLKFACDPALDSLGYDKSLRFCF
mmetsp:Transcript_16545/g.21890  ORF Transcript_16545/g.21890 Transcript_16545/m.21890 type:complete len:969 (-) Transcript_16545:142-3048(-)